MRSKIVLTIVVHKQIGHAVAHCSVVIATSHILQATSVWILNLAILGRHMSRKCQLIALTLIQWVGLISQYAFVMLGVKL